MTVVQELKNLALRQKEALLSGRISEALELMEERERLIDRLRKMGSKVHKVDTDRASERHGVDIEGDELLLHEEVLEEVLAIDGEMMEMISTNLAILKSNMDEVSRARNLIRRSRRKTSSRRSGKLNISA